MSELEKSDQQVKPALWIRIVPFFLGLSFMHLGEIWETRLTEATGFFEKASAKTLVELGVALIVAGAVSWVFDVAYHQIAFGSHIKIVEDKIKELSRSVSASNQVLRSAQVYGVDALSRRRTHEEKAEWRSSVDSVISGSEKFLLCMGRSFDELLPKNFKESGIYPLIRSQLESRVKVVFIIANTFDLDSSFRQECIHRSGEDGADRSYGPSRDALRQLLRLVDELDAWENFSVRLLQKSPPFALFISEKKAIVEPYLPYLEGGEGIYFEVSSRSHLDKSVPVNSALRGDFYDAYFRCFSEVFNEAESVASVLKRWMERHGEQDRKKYETLMPMAEKLQKFNITISEEPSVAVIRQHPDKPESNQSFDMK